MTFHCIADEDTVRGFALAGIAGTTATSAIEARAALEEIETRSDCGIVIITTRLAAVISPDIDAFRSRRNIPLIVVIPGPRETKSEHKTLLQLVQQAIGIHLGSGTEKVP